jgi:hypothetical protein
MVRSLIFCLMILGANLGGAPLLAARDNISVTISTEIAPVFQNGELTGCALNFQAGKNDYTYFAGDLALINGSLNLYTPEGKAPFYALKLGVMRDGSKAYVAPSTAFLLSDENSNKVDFLKTIDSETPGFRLFTFAAGETSLKIMTETTAQDSTIRIGYTMHSGSMSSIIPISLSMKNLNLDNPSESVRDERGSRKWWDCNLAALEAAVKRTKASRSR